MKILTFLFLCGFTTIGKTELCVADMTMYEMPKGVLKEILALVTTGTISDFAGCSSKFEVDPDKIVFWLYNKEHHDTPVRLDHDNPTEIDPHQKTVFAIHGWTCNITGYGFPEMKTAFLKRYPNSNVILIEWATYSIDLYANSFCYIPKITEIIGKFICNLHSKFNVDISQLHLVGHSLGGQISGLTGQQTQSQCNQKIGRITALDPAGPLFQTISESRRLDGSDAVLVDVIHTNQGAFGFHGTCGTVDYYPNCGYRQPGCTHFEATINITKLLNIPFSNVGCHHLRSIDLFNESLLGDGFKAKSCKLCPGLPPFGPCIADLIDASTSVMGEDHPKFPSPDSKYYLETTDKAPFVKTRN